LTQRTLDRLDAGLGDLLTSWEPYALVLVAIVGLELAQTAFEAAPLPASLPAITIAEPLCGIGLGAGLFSQHIRLGPLYLAAELVCLVMMVLGVLLLARSPVVTGHETAGRT
ncbi:MAG: DMT family transporter, partial [Acidimicrobiales bacterium]